MAGRGPWEIPFLPERPPQRISLDGTTEISELASGPDEGNSTR